MDNKAPGGNAGDRVLDPDKMSAGCGLSPALVPGNVAAAALSAGDAALGETAAFTTAERSWLLRVARDSVTSFVRGTNPCEWNASEPRLSRKQACFVTLSRNGALRGCIGSVMPLLPLYLGVQTNARAAASRDPRFPPVSAGELGTLRIEISVLTEPEALRYTSPDDLLEQLQPGVSGVLLQLEGQVGTFLPQVWEMVPDRTEFLNRLAEKAGFPRDAWREPGAVVSVYRAEHFQESTA